jgi:RNA-directed DNA polymerase
MALEQRGYIVQLKWLINQIWEESMMDTKSFKISKRLVWEAWKRIKTNGGAHGVDLVSIEAFETNLSNNLYKIWNRMSSGSYFPSPVRRVDIPKDDGTTRPLGIPTVGDRVAQMVVKMVLEPELDPVFHPDSYGYRPRKSAIQAVHQARQRCWKYAWVLDLDIKGFFDNIDHELLMKAVEKHTACPWTRLYIRRWLVAPVVHPNGDIEEKGKGTPQGGVISPLLANLYLHYALDVWMKRHYPSIPFERYADDVVCHCKTQRQAQFLLDALQKRLAECALELHPKKTKIVYCKENGRDQDYPLVAFDFLGFCFKPRRAMTKCRRVFTGFTPAISRKSLKRISTTIRNWKIQKWTGRDIEDIAKALNPVILGWFNYYKHFGRKELQRVRRMLDFALIRWARRKYKKLGRSYRQATKFLARLREQQPKLFAHWYV